MSAVIGMPPRKGPVMTTSSPSARSGKNLAATWSLRLWLGSRVALGTAIAEAAVLWLAIEALSNQTVGPVAFGPVIVAMLLIGVVPTLPIGRSAATSRVLNLLTVIGGGLILVEGLSFPETGWTDRAWLSGTGDSLIFRASPAAMPVWVPILVVVAAWWWRQRRGDNASDDVRTTFRLGAIVLIAVALTGAFSGMATDSQIATGATVFFAAILLAMGWARQAAVHPGELSGGDSVAALTNVAGVVVVLLAATTLAAVASPAAFDTIVWLLSPVIWAIQTVILGLSWLFLIILFPIFWLVDWLLSLRSVQERPPVTVQVFDDPSPSAVAVVETNTTSLPEEIRIALAATVLVILVLIVARTALRRVVGAAVASDVEQHVEFDPRSLLRRRRRSSDVQGDADPLADLRNDPRFRHTVAIREIYTGFLRAAAEADLARRRSETARRHTRRVASTLGSPVEDIETLASAYGPVRYGIEPATDEQRRTVAAAWDRVSPRLQSVADAQPKPARRFLPGQRA